MGGGCGEASRAVAEKTKELRKGALGAGDAGLKL